MCGVLVVPGLEKGPQLQMDGVFGAAAVGVGRACCRQRGYETGVGEKDWARAFLGPKGL